MTNSKKEINIIVQREKFVMLQFKNGWVYWLIRHYTHINFRHAKKVKLGKMPKPTNTHLIDNQYLYLTSILK